MEGVKLCIKVGYRRTGITEAVTPPLDRTRVSITRIRSRISRDTVRVSRSVRVSFRVRDSVRKSATAEPGEGNFFGLPKVVIIFHKL